MQKMSLSELERMVSLMENEAFGETDEPRTTEDVIATVEASIMARLETRLKEMGNTPTHAEIA